MAGGVECADFGSRVDGRRIQGHCTGPAIVAVITVDGGSHELQQSHWSGATKLECREYMF